MHPWTLGERGQRKPSLGIVERIAKVLESDAQTLLCSTVSKSKDSYQRIIVISTCRNPAVREDDYMHHL